MLDVKLLRENLDLVKERLAAKGAKIDWDLFVTLDRERREALAEFEKLKEQKNRLSGEIGKLKKSGGDATALMKEVEGLAEAIRKAEAPLPEIEKRFEDFMLTIPNLPHESVPPGAGAEQNREVRRWGEPPRFDFPAKNHWEIGEELGILDFARAAKIAQSRFAVYYGAGAQLERALISFMLDLHTRERGYREVLPPFLVNRAAMTGTGQLPKFEEDMFRIADPELFLVPTAEVPLTNLRREEIVEKENLPIRYAAYTACFRREAGSYGQDVRGLIRQHQFNKVELVKLTEPETSYDELEKMVRDAEEVLRRLKIPYRVTWGSPRPRLSTSKYGCRDRRPTARSARARTAKIFRRGAPRFATGPKRAARPSSFIRSTAPAWQSAERWWRCWKIISKRTEPSLCRRPYGLIWAAWSGSLEIMLKFEL